MVDSTETKPKTPRKSPNPRKPASPKAAKSEPAKTAATRAAPKAKVAPNSNGRDWKAEADKYTAQAAKTARAAAETGKVKAGAALHGLSRLIGETAGTVDEKMGPQYGDYARYAAEAVAGTATALDQRDLDALMGEARDFVRKSPAVAIGAAAVLGFVLMRLAKGSGKTGKTAE